MAEHKITLGGLAELAQLFPPDFELVAGPNGFFIRTRDQEFVMAVPSFMYHSLLRSLRAAEEALRRGDTVVATKRLTHLRAALGETPGLARLQAKIDQAAACAAA